MDDETPNIRYAPGVDPRVPVFRDQMVVTAKWMPLHSALLMSNEAFDEAVRRGWGLEVPEQPR
jgi:hypothetical protein